MAVKAAGQNPSHALRNRSRQSVALVPAGGAAQWHHDGQPTQNRAPSIAVCLALCTILIKFISVCWDWPRCRARHVSAKVNRMQSPQSNDRGSSGMDSLSNLRQHAGSCQVGGPVQQRLQEAGQALLRQHAVPDGLQGCEEGGARHAGVRRRTSTNSASRQKCLGCREPCRGRSARSPACQVGHWAAAGARAAP